MKRQWLSIWDLWSSRINAWELHLRLLSFLSFIGVCLLLVFWLWLWPAQAVLKQLTDDALKQGDELQAMGDNLKAKAMPMDDDQALADQIAAVNIMLNLTNQALKNAQSLQTQIPLTQALFDVLRRYEGLVLLHKSTVTPDSPIDNSAQTETTVLPAGMTRQNVQLTVSGPYLELMLYVEALESQLPNIHWTSMLMKSGKPPTTLTLNLFEIAEYPR
jgi:hypothetical protein|tara:strand:+ start:388 stop:1038 length:651 start_codon:yes stop_codon:yes gene_type:complete